MLTPAFLSVIIGGCQCWNWLVQVDVDNLKLQQVHLAFSLPFSSFRSPLDQARAIEALLDPTDARNIGVRKRREATGSLQSEPGHGLMWQHGCGRH